jgi:ABC-type bacteriocin/lantibiotic exporter with double-glycine peptidase domain
MRFKVKTDLLNNVEMIWSVIESKSKVNIYYIILLLITSAFLEVITIGAVVPLMYILMEINQNNSKNYFVVYLIKNFPNMPSETIAVMVGLTFVVLVIINLVTKNYLLIVQVRTSMNIGRDLSVKAFDKIMRKNYEFHINSNSGEIQSLISKSYQLIYNFIQPIINIISNIVIMAFIIMGLLIINTIATLLVILSLISVYALINFYTIERTLADSKSAAMLQGKVNTIIIESLGGIRDIILNGNYNLHIEKYKCELDKLQKIYGRLQIISNIPKSSIETFGILTLLIVAYFFAKNNDFTNVIPMIGMFALAAQRILPLAQGVYSGMLQIGGNNGNINDALKVIMHPDLNNGKRKRIVFSKNIEFKSVHFKYITRNIDILQNINFRINSGDKVGVVGKTGSGKSTLIDLLMGLIKPIKGGIYVDGIELVDENRTSWMMLISHVPQSIFLINGTISENICIDQNNEVNDAEKIKKSAIDSCIHDDIMKMPDGYATRVGERGLLLSGGQIQRIGIARALFKRRPIIVLDEATSALDEETERKIIDNIKKNYVNTTILIISHRQSTLTNCDKIIHLQNGTVNLVSSKIKAF